MKKQLFSLVIVLAFIIIGGTNAWAQSTGTLANPWVHANGSTHTLTVTANANNTFQWSWDAATTGTAMTVNGATNTNTLNITWDEDAAGIYYFDVTETRNDITAPNVCTPFTVRRVYVYIIDFDVEVYISDENGVPLTGGDLKNCSSGTTAAYGNGPTGVAFDNTINTDGNLSTYDPNDNSTLRYVGLRVYWATPPVGYTFVEPDIDNIRFTYTLTTDAGADFVSFAGTAATTGTVTVSETTETENVFVATVIYNPRWGVDFTTSVQALDCQVIMSGNQVGQERTTNENTNRASATPPRFNLTDTETILGAPATSTITTN